jgi:acetyl-CoA decarbonylase/synthase complex subunit delta
MAVQMPTQKWSGKIGQITIGATQEEGGTRTSKVTIGGQDTLPFLSFDGTMPNKPPIAMEVLDVVPEEGYPDQARQAFGDVMNDPAQWAKACVEQYGADLICLRLLGTNPEEGDRSPEEAAETVKAVLGAVGVPLIVYGCGHAEKDAQVMEAVSMAAKGERLLLGLAEEDRYKSIAVACTANKHGLVAFSNLDINLAKQLNILLTDFDFPLNEIVMDPLQAGLGYGLEYSYSVIERIRLAALMGDKTLQVPII